MHEPITQEETLDPADWPALRELGHRMLDDMLDNIATIRERPAWQPMPPSTLAALRGPLPRHEQPADQVYAEFQDHVLPYPGGNVHPSFWAWVMGGGTPLGMLSEMLAAGLNPNVGGGDHAAVRVEEQVIGWCKEMLGFPAAASGLLVSGGSMANLNGLAVARTAQASVNVREEGLRTSERQMTLYGSVEMHSSIQRAIEVLGLGNQFLRRIPVDGNYRINIGALRTAIAADLDAGLQPICIIGNAGTVNTGAIDPLAELADIAAEHRMWFHVDGAFGALAALAPALRPLLRGMERSDSLAFDLHKWLYLPFEAGCILVRNKLDHRRTFTLTPDYLQHQDRGVAGGESWPSDYGIQLSRGFRALKVWMALKTYGVEKYGRLIQQNVDQAHYLAACVHQTPGLELLAPVELNITCFRFIAPGLDDARLNHLNEELLLRLQEAGLAVPSGTRLGGRYALRCANTNHRTRREDLDALVTNVVRIGNSLVAENWSMHAAPQAAQSTHL
ncbi:MAG: aspartate aminotransferase family protein [Herpetosiphon sp.]